MMTARILAAGIVMPLLGACGQADTSSPASATAASAGIVSATPAVPGDKSVLIERCVEVYQDSVVQTLADTTRCAVEGGALKPDTVSADKWFPLDGLTELVPLYGRGAGRTLRTKVRVSRVRSSA